MGEVRFRALGPAEAHRIAEIDRSEVVTRGYAVRGGELRSAAVDWKIPRWSATGSHDRAVPVRIERVRERLLAGDVAFGAFDGDSLVGFVILHEGLEQGVAQLAELFVSRGHRRRGIARRLTELLVERARAGGARRLYVSAVPSESAVGFYLSQGFRVAPEPHPDLYALEPDDIHMIRELEA